MDKMNAALIWRCCWKATLWNAIVYLALILKIFLSELPSGDFFDTRLFALMFYHAFLVTMPITAVVMWALQAGKSMTRQRKTNVYQDRDGADWWKRSDRFGNWKNN